MRIVLELLFRKDLTDHLAKKKRKVFCRHNPSKELKALYFLFVLQWFKIFSTSENGNCKRMCTSVETTKIIIHKIHILNFDKMT